MPKNDDLDIQIKNAADLLRDTAEDNLKALQNAYWSAHKDLADSSFTSRWEQMNAIRKLSQLGLALHAAGEAYKAINTARCH